MILYLLLDCRRGVVLSSDVSNELLKEWKKAILDLGVLIDGWPYSISAALVHEEGFSVCLPLGQHSVPHLIQRLSSIQDGFLPSSFSAQSPNRNPNLDPAIACLSQVVQHVRSQQSSPSSSRLIRTTRVIVISMSTHLFAPFVATLQQLTIKLAQCNATLEFFHIIDIDCISSTFSCQSDVHSIANAMNEYDHFMLKSSPASERPIRKLIAEIAAQMWEFSCQIRIDSSLLLRCRGRLAMHPLSPTIRNNIREMQSNGGFHCDLVNTVSVDHSKCGLSQTLLYGLPIHLIPSDDELFKNGKSVIFKDLLKSLKNNEVFLFRISHDLLDFSFLPSGVYHYCIGTVPQITSQFDSNSIQYIHPICIQGLIPTELLMSLPLDELRVCDDDNNSSSSMTPLSEAIKHIHEFNSQKFLTHDIDAAIREAKIASERLSREPTVFAPRIAPKAKARRILPKTSSRGKRGAPSAVTMPSTNGPGNEYQIPPTAAQLIHQQCYPGLTNEATGSIPINRSISLSPSVCSSLPLWESSVSFKDLNDQANNAMQLPSIGSLNNKGVNSTLNKSSTNSHQSPSNEIPSPRSIGLVKRIQSRIADKRGSTTTAIKNMIISMNCDTSQ